jgi:hypothetical protein
LLGLAEPPSISERVPLGDSCERPELPRRHADEALEVMGELAPVREAGALRASGYINRRIEPHPNTPGSA